MGTQTAALLCGLVRKFTLLLFLAGGINLWGFAQSPSWASAGKAGASNPEGGQNIYATRDGGFLVAAKFQMTTNIGGNVLTAQAGNETYIAKYDSTGTFQWVTAIYGQALRERIVGLDEDDDGNIYIAGNYESYVEIDSVALNFVGTGIKGSYLARFSPSGKISWLRPIGEIGEQVLVGMDVDNEGRILLGGQFRDTLAFGGPDTLFSKGGTDLFVAAFDSTGALQWKEGYGSTGFEVAWAFAANNSGDLALAGVAADTLQAFSSQLGAPGQESMVVVMTDRTGGYLGAITEPGIDSGSEFTDLEVSELRDIYIGGNYSDTLLISGQMVVSNGGRDMVLIKYDSQGTLEWASSAGGTELDELNGLELDIQGNAYITGYYQGSITFDTISAFSSTVIGDFFMVRYNPGGAAIWLETAGAGFFDYSAGFDISLREGKVFVTGEFTSTANFGGIPLTSSGTSDMFWGILCQENDVFTSAMNTALCTGQQFSVDYAVFGCFDSGNVFSLQMSDPAGSFAAPVTIGTSSGLHSGNIIGDLPLSVASGNGYRFRVVSSAPAAIGPDNGWDVVIDDGNALSINSGGDTTLCQGDTLLLDAGPGFTTFAWSTGASTQSIPVVTGGWYNLAAIDSAGCLSRDTIEILGPYANPDKPSVYPSGSPVLCTGSTLDLDAGFGFSNYWWSTGDSTQVTTVNAPGSYYLLVTNASGCSTVSDTIYVVPNTRPSISVVGDTLVSSPATSYQWYWNGNAIVGATQHFFVPTSSAAYYVQVVDGNGCTEFSDSVDFLISVLPPNGSDAFDVYPVPASTQLKVASRSGTPLQALEVWDAQGRLIRKSEGLNTLNYILPVESYPAGLYLLKIRTFNGEVARNFMISR